MLIFIGLFIVIFSKIRLYVKLPICLFYLATFILVGTMPESDYTTLCSSLCLVITLVAICTYFAERSGSATSFIEFNCPFCETPLKFDARKRDDIDQCQNCHETVTITDDTAKHEKARQQHLSLLAAIDEDEDVDDIDPSKLKNLSTEPQGWGVDFFGYRPEVIEGQIIEKD